jgi:multidrug resistance efflux pump
MRWQPSLIARLARVRDVRMRMAEMELSRADGALQASRDAERNAQLALEQAAAQRKLDIAQANQALLSRQAGGRHGISGWHDARKRAERTVQHAESRAGAAVSERLDNELACSAARRQWRDARLDVERLRMLVEAFRDPSS